MVCPIDKVSCNDGSHPSSFYIEVIKKKSDVTYLDISSESALQYMLTAGAVMPKRISDMPKDEEKK